MFYEYKMDASKKKRVAQETVNSDDDIGCEDDIEDEVDSDNDDSSTMDVNEEIQVEFEARCPEDSDFHGIRALLAQLFLKANINISELSDTIISQNYVGSVIKQCDIPDDSDEDDDDDTVLGLISVINMTERKELECNKQIKSFLMDKCRHCGQGEEFQQRFFDIINSGKSQVGFLISERFINIPAPIAIPMYASLRKEIEKANGKKMKYQFDYFLMISKSYRADVAHSKGKSKEDDIIFIQAEDEILRKYAALGFNYSVASEHDSVGDGKWSSDGMEATRTVMLIPSTEVDEALIEMKAVITPDAP